MKKTILLLAAFVTIAAGANAQTERTNRTNTRKHITDGTDTRTQDSQPIERENRGTNAGTSTAPENAADRNNTNNNTNNGTNTNTSTGGTGNTGVNGTNSNMNGTSTGTNR